MGGEASAEKTSCSPRSFKHLSTATQRLCMLPLHAPPKVCMVCICSPAGVGGKVDHYPFDLYPPLLFESTLPPKFRNVNTLPDRKSLPVGGGTYGRGQWLKEVRFNRLNKTKGQMLTTKGGYMKVHNRGSVFDGVCRRRGGAGVEGVTGEQSRMTN
eukprot:127136-Hanusia_phi.AAC.2